MGVVIREFRSGPIAVAHGDLRAGKPALIHAAVAVGLAGDMVFDRRFLLMLFRQLIHEGLIASVLADAFTAYDKYLSRNFDSLCGTQRDLYRVLNRVEKGTMTSRKIDYLSGFSDLIQYIGICSTDQTKQEICFSFIEKLLSEDTQRSVKNYNMFSVNQTNIYDGQDEQFMQLEKILSKQLKTVNVFASSEDLKQIKRLSFDALTGNSQAKKDLLKYLT